MDRDDASGALRVEVVYSPRASQVEQVALTLPAGATVGDALAASPWFAGGVDAALAIGVWGKLATAVVALRDRDRVEVYRPLQVDPKEARRQRHRTQRGR